MAQKILIVDDLALNRHILKATLSSDYDIIEADNGETALALLRDGYQSISAVLLDILMPVMDGYELLRRMREDPLLAALPVIMLTASDDENSCVKALALGANDFVTKPYHPDIIKHCLRNSIALYEANAAMDALHKECAAAEQRLAEANERIELFANNIPGGIAAYVCSPEGISAGHIRLAYCNDSYAALFGYSRPDYMEKSARNPISMIFSEDMHILAKQYAKLVQDGAPISCIYRIHVKGGGFKWIEHKAVAVARDTEGIHVNAMLLDVTERHENMERLRIAAEEYRLAMLHTGNIVSRFTVADRTSTIASETALRFGIPEKIVDLPYGPIRRGDIAPESRQAFTDFYEEILHGGISGKGVFEYKMPAGWRWLEARYSTVFSENNEPLFAVVSFSDITERLEKEAIYTKWEQSLRERDPASYTLFRCNLSKEVAFDSMEGSLLRFPFSPMDLSFSELTLAYMRQCVYEEDRERYTALLDPKSLLSSYYHGKRCETLDYREQTPDGALLWRRLTIDLVEYPSSRDIQAYLMYEDIHSSRQFELSVIERAECDPLTGALNRTTFAANVERILQTALPMEHNALLMLDVDGFKLLNDSLGHSVGDAALVDITASLRSILRKDDLLGRLGGDEFLIFLHGISDKAAVLNKARHICALVRRSFTPLVQISGSVGVALAPLDGQDFDTLYKKADSAMYHVKDLGKDGCTLYQSGMEKRLSPALGEENARKKPRILIVNASTQAHDKLAKLFGDEYHIERARGSAAALVRLRHYGAAIAVVLLDLSLPDEAAFQVLERTRNSAELRSIPVVVLGTPDERDVCLKALEDGASDFMIKPVDPDALRIRVLSAIRKAENERCRAQSRLQELQNSEASRYRIALKRSGIMVLEHDWVGGSFLYDPAMGDYVAGSYDSRKLWHILLADMVADTETVRQMQGLVHDLAEDRSRTEAAMTVRLKTPNRAFHYFRLTIFKQTNEFGLTDKMILTLCDIGPELPSTASAANAEAKKG